MQDATRTHDAAHMTATARRVADTLEHEVDVNGRHVIVTDEPERLGGTDHGPAPHELLPATLAACAATTIAMYAQSRSWDIGEVAVDADYVADSVPRRMALTVHLTEDLTPEQKRRLERVAAACPARRALEAGFSFEERVVEAPRRESKSGRAPQAPAARPAASHGELRRRPRSGHGCASQTSARA